MRGSRRRVLIYSHDSFGLGHLRRCRALANAMVSHDRDLDILILSGSPIIGQFNFGRNVDFVRLPGIIKLRDGNYSSHSLRLRIDETVNLRAAIIGQTAMTFAPDLLIVDKEPHGIRDEVRACLDLLEARGVPMVLGLRDILDTPDRLAPEWERKGVMPSLRDVYREIWVYGLERIHDPLAGLAVPERVRRKMVYTGYLRRSLPRGRSRRRPFGRTPFVLVTAGGGGDGAAFIDWVIRTYEATPGLPPAFIVFGPFLKRGRRRAFENRIADLVHVSAIAFDNRPELLMQEAAGVLAMGGYNTFCEILSFDKPAIIVPRTRPRMEQYLRAANAGKLGLVRMLTDDRQADTAPMAAAIRNLFRQPPPSAAAMDGLLDGLDTVNRRVGRLLARPERQDLRLAERPLAGLPA